MFKRFMIQAPEDDLLGGGGSPNPNPAPNPAPNPTPAPQVSWPENWKDGLGELGKDSALAPINDIPNLVKSFIHAQKSLGKDKIVIPDKFATPEDWTNNVWKKLGLPESADKYEFKVPEGTDAAFVTKFKEFALKQGILPQQAEHLFQFYGGHVKEVMDAQEAAHKTRFEEAVSSLKKDFGVAYEKKLGVASNLFNQVADDETKALFKETGLGNNPQVIKLFAKMAEMLGEDKFVPANEKGNLGFTPAEAQTKINEIMGNKEHPYFNSSHPSHKDAVAEMGKLFAMTTASQN